MLPISRCRVQLQGPDAHLVAAGSLFWRRRHILLSAGVEAILAVTFVKARAAAAPAADWTSSR